MPAPTVSVAELVSNRGNNILISDHVSTADKVNSSWVKCLRNISFQHITQHRAHDSTGHTVQYRTQDTAWDT